MPRKKVVDEILKWTPVSVRFIPGEHEQIKRAAKLRGVSVNRFIRQASQIGAQRVLEAAASADDELRRIISAAD